MISFYEGDILTLFRKEINYFESLSPLLRTNRTKLMFDVSDDNDMLDFFLMFLAMSKHEF